MCETQPTDVTLLSAGVTVKASVAAYQWRYFAFDIDNATSPASFQFVRETGNGDPDMYLRCVSLVLLGAQNATYTQT